MTDILDLPDDVPEDVLDDAMLVDLYRGSNPEEVVDLVAVDTVFAYHAAQTTFERLLVTYTSWLTRCATELASNDPVVTTDLIHAGADTLRDLCRGDGPPPSAAVVYRKLYVRLITDLRALRRVGVAQSTWGRGRTRLPYLPSSPARTPSSSSRDTVAASVRVSTVKRCHAKGDRHVPSIKRRGGNAERDHV